MNTKQRFNVDMTIIKNKKNCEIICTFEICILHFVKVRGEWPQKMGFINLRGVVMKIRKSLIMMVLAVLLSTLAADAFSDDAVVVYDKDSLSYFIVQNGDSYAIVKRCSSAELTEDDKLSCDLQSIGTKEAYNATKKQKMTLKVEFFGLTRRDAVEKYYKLCGL